MPLFVVRVVDDPKSPVDEGATAFLEELPAADLVNLRKEMYGIKYASLRCDTSML